MFDYVERSAESHYRPEVVYDVAILLGGVTDERVMAQHGRPAYNGNVERLTETFRLLHDGKARFAILSGAAMTPSLARFGEAKVLAEQLREWGVEDDRLLVEPRARNTRENAFYSAEIVRARGFGRVLVVTSAFHARRALECFEAVGLPVDVMAVDYRTYESDFDPATLLPRASALAGTTTCLHEIFGRLVYRARGYTKAIETSSSVQGGLL